MGPTNVALVKLFQADQKLREAQSRLDAVTKNVRIQERRTKDLEEKLKNAQQKLKEQQATAGQLELDIKTRDARIERLRSQQQNAKNNKEYQAFLIEINTEKVDRNKVEEQALKALEGVERGQTEVKEMQTALEAERNKLATMTSEIGEKVGTLQAEIDSLKPARNEAAAAVPKKALDAFEKYADRYDGEALSPLLKPNPKREEYVCGACMIELVVDIYNKLHTRDDLIFCPSCQRILYIPNDLPPEMAINKPKEKREPRAKNVGASAPRQQSASAIRNSIAVEDDAPAENTAGTELPADQESAPAAEQQ
jgi:predicted  nucleic acid-binding Zn-ribbon protein